MSNASKQQLATKYDLNPSLRKEEARVATGPGMCTGCGICWKTGDAVWLIRYAGQATWYCSSILCDTPPVPSEQDETERADATAPTTAYVPAAAAAAEGDAENTVVEAAAATAAPADEPEPSAAPQPAITPASEEDIVAVTRELQRIEQLVDTTLTEPAGVGKALIRPNPAKVGMYTKFVFDALHPSGSPATLSA